MWSGCATLVNTSTQLLTVYTTRAASWAKNWQSALTDVQYHSCSTETDGYMMHPLNVQLNLLLRIRFKFPSKSIAHWFKAHVASTTFLPIFVNCYTRHKQTHYETALTVNKLQWQKTVVFFLSEHFDFISLTVWNYQVVNTKKRSIKMVWYNDIDRTTRPTTSACLLNGEW